MRQRKRTSHARLIFRSWLLWNAMFLQMLFYQ
jgi:hypothetical protein